MKWEKYYHLPEIDEIREKIIDTYTNKLVFLEGPHEYYLDGVQYMCVSEVTHKYKPTSSEEMAENCVKKWKRDQDPSYKYYGMSKQEILDKWAEISGAACEFGTETHAFGESMFYYMTEQYDKILPECSEKFKDGKPNPTTPQERAIVQFWNDLPETFVPVLAETKVFNKTGTPYAGTFDILFYYVNEKDRSKSGLVIFDYKGLDINIPILTKDGWKTMGTVQEGDIVYDEDGKETNVIHTSQIHMNKCYEIEFDNNEKIIADKDHRWPIIFSCQKRIKNEVLTTEEIYNFMKGHPNRRYTINIPKIKTFGGFKSEDKHLPIDPYVLGVWLGDGHSACGMITNMYDEIFNEIEKRGFGVGKDVSQGGAGKAKSRTIHGLFPLLKSLNLIKNKHIPYEYLTASYNQKLDLLRGIMDTDGYYNACRKRFVLVTTKRNQVDFCVELLSSMGIKSTIVNCKKYCNSKIIDGYDVTFTTKDYPFLIRQIKVERPKVDKTIYTNIKCINEVETIPTRCIQVDSPKHTFVFGKNMMITHNTNESLIKNFKGQTLLWPFQDLLDCNQSYYTLQLSLYGIPLQNIGCNVVGRRLIHVLPNGTYDKIPIIDMTDRVRDALNIPSAQEIIDSKIL